MILIKVRSVKGSVIYLFHISHYFEHKQSSRANSCFFLTQLTITVLFRKFLLMSDVPVITLMFSGVSCA